MTEPSLQEPVANQPGCLLVCMQSVGLCIIFSIITLLARSAIVKGNPNELMATSLTILTLGPILECWFPAMLCAWCRGSSKALVIGAVVVALFNALVLAAWLEGAVASAG